MAAYAITAILIQSISKYKNSQTAFIGMRVFYVFIYSMVCIYRILSFTLYKETALYYFLG